MELLQSPRKQTVYFVRPLPRFPTSLLHIFPLKKEHQPLPVPLPSLSVPSAVARTLAEVPVRLPPRAPPPRLFFQQPFLSPFNQPWSEKLHTVRLLLLSPASLELIANNFPSTSPLSSRIYPSLRRSSHYPFLKRHALLPLTWTYRRSSRSRPNSF